MKIMIRIIIIIIIMSRFERRGSHDTGLQALLQVPGTLRGLPSWRSPPAALRQPLTGPHWEPRGLWWRHVNESVARMKEPVDFESVRELVAALQLHFQVDYELHRRWSVRRYLEVMQRRGVERQELLKDILERAGPHGLAYGCHLEDLG